MLKLGFAIMAVFVIVLVMLEARPKLPRWIYGAVKTAAALLFIAVGVADIPADMPGRDVFLSALIMSFVGDVLLIPQGKKRVFLAGLVAFLIAHILYVPAFIARGLDVNTTVAVALVLLVPIVFVLRWLRAHVKNSMWPPVVAYVFVISAMVASASGAVAGGGGVSPVLVVGALSFWLSDVCVARHRFVAPGFPNKLFGVPLYFFGQLGLIAGFIG